MSVTDVPPVMRDVEYELARLVRRSRNNAIRLVAEIHPELDFAGYLLLVTIRDRALVDPEGTRATDVAESFGMHKSTISRGLAQLERLGLIARTIDPKDGRARLVVLTGDGARRLQNVQDQRGQRLADVLRRWRPESLRQLALLLRQLNEDLE